MRRRIEILSLMMVALLATGCGRAPIKPELMEDILFDIYRVDACLTVTSRECTPEERVKYYDSVFEKHEVTKEEFDEALDWYAYHTKEWQVIHENLEKRTDEYVTKVENYEYSKQAKPVVQDSIDTLDIWVPLSTWEWRSGNGEIDRRQTDYSWEDREYFTGVVNLRFEMKMRCWGNDGDSVTTMMVVRYSKGEDTLKYVAPVDSVERIYKFNKMTRDKNVSSLRVILMDTVEGLEGVNVDEVRLNYAFGSNGERSAKRIKRELWLLRRETRFAVSRRK